ncbi:MAG: thiolase family protein [Oscillospiraceae bacterium]|nr:thiolase family protein [Oscillospiraceae bacterium]
MSGLSASALKEIQFIMETKNVVIVDACRTAVGKMGGACRPLSALDMACATIKGNLDRSGIDPSEIDEVILGHCRQTSDEPNIARVAALKVGIPEKCAAHTVMRQCASGMTAVQNGAMSIMTGVNDVVIAGGTESMSNAVFYVRNARWGVGTGTTEFVDALTEGQFKSQPEEIYGRYNMGATAERVAQELGITREEQDAFSLESQRRAIAAIDSGRFKDEIVPMTVPQGRKKDPIVFDTDEFPNRTTNEKKMAKLKPVFSIDVHDDGKMFNSPYLTGTVTAGSSSGRNDGASSLLLMSEEKAQELGLKPLAKIIGMGASGCDPQQMGLGPVYAVPKALKHAGLTMDDIQLIELNEAFAAQSLGCIKLLGWEDKMDIINVNGGAIALGHPVGSSGSRIIVTLVHEMKKRGLKYGLATLCIAGGMGQATVIEMC